MHLAQCETPALPLSVSRVFITALFLSLLLFLSRSRALFLSLQVEIELRDELYPLMFDANQARGVFSPVANTIRTANQARVVEKQKLAVDVLSTRILKKAGLVSPGGRQRRGNIQQSSTVSAGVQLKQLVAADDSAVTPRTLAALFPEHASAIEAAATAEAARTAALQAAVAAAEQSKSKHAGIHGSGKASAHTSSHSASASASALHHHAFSDKAQFASLASATGDMLRRQSSLVQLQAIESQQQQQQQSQPQRRGSVQLPRPSTASAARPVSATTHGAAAQRPSTTAGKATSTGGASSAKTGAAGVAPPITAARAKFQLAAAKAAADRAHKKALTQHLAPDLPTRLRYKLPFVEAVSDALAAIDREAEKERARADFAKRQVRFAISGFVAVVD